MTFAEAVIALGLLSGIFSILLFTFTIFFEKSKNRSRALLIWAVLFMAAAFAAIEYASWLDGYFLFDIVTHFNFPLLAYFAIWFAFLAWLFESRGERKIWMMLTVALFVLMLVALSCPNCVRF